jgi:hypothetical protein
MSETRVRTSIDTSRPLAQRKPCAPGKTTPLGDPYPAGRFNPVSILRNGRL